MEVALPVASLAVEELQPRLGELSNPSKKISWRKQEMVISPLQISTRWILDPEHICLVKPHKAQLLLLQMVHSTPILGTIGGPEAVERVS